jgi:hypothetical protein
LSSNTYISDPLTTDCTVSASFSFMNHNVGGTMSRLSGTLTLQDNGSDQLTHTADRGLTFIGEQS